MSKSVFLNLADEGRTLELKIDGDSTWMDVADEFVYFLQGSGYQVTREDIADHFNESRINTDEYTQSGGDSDYNWPSAYGDVNYNVETGFDNTMNDYNLNLGDTITINTKTK